MLLVSYSDLVFFALRASLILPGLAGTSRAPRLRSFSTSKKKDSPELSKNAQLLALGSHGAASTFGNKRAE